jgi:hypothetical protein
MTPFWKGLQLRDPFFGGGSIVAFISTTRVHGLQDSTLKGGILKKQWRYKKCEGI